MPQVHRVIQSTPVRTLAEYQRLGGGEGLRRALTMSPEAIVDLIDQSGLRGRGGSGFPTGTKWRTVRQFASPGTRTPVVINAAEGEPGTFKDRTLIRQNPYAVLEGALIAAVAMSASHVIIALKESFDTEHRRLVAAIDEIYYQWGEELITMSNEVLRIDIALGPSEYLFGEETALLEVLENRPPFPRVTPPWRRGLDADAHDFHSAAGLQLATEAGASSAPILIQNVETLSNVPNIVRHGSDWFREVGTSESPGSIVCTVTGMTNRAGVGEFAMGTSIREVIESIGGGVAEGRAIRVILNGVSNVPILPDQMDTQLSYEHMSSIGSGLGSSSFIVVDDSVPWQAIAAGVARYLSVESCGQCAPCKQDSTGIAAELVSDAPTSSLVENWLGTVSTGARCGLASQVETVVGKLVGQIDEWAEIESHPIFPLVNIEDDIAIYDEAYVNKNSDWTFRPDFEESDVWPAQRLANQTVEIRTAGTPSA